LPVLAGLPGPAGDSLHAGPVRTVTPAMTARHVRITRCFVFGVFSLATICNLS